MKITNIDWDKAAILSADMVVLLNAARTELASIAEDEEGSDYFEAAKSHRELSRNVKALLLRVGCELEKHEIGDDEEPDYGDSTEGGRR